MHQYPFSYFINTQLPIIPPRLCSVLSVRLTFFILLYKYYYATIISVIHFFFFNIIFIFVC